MNEDKKLKGYVVAIDDVNLVLHNDLLLGVMLQEGSQNKKPSYPNTIVC